MNELETKELFNGQAGLLDDGTQSTHGEVASRMVGNDGATMRHGVVPDFMAAFRVTVKDKASFTQSSNNVNGPQRRKARHVSTGTDTVRETFVRGFLPNVRRVNWMGNGSLCSKHDSMSFRATSSAISNVSATVRPCATSPCKTGLVAKNSPSFNRSTVIGIRYSDITIPVYRTGGLDARAQDQACFKGVSFKSA